PVQVAEQQRIAELRRTNPAAAAAELGGAKHVSPTMTEPAREALKRITSALRKAAGVAEPATAPRSRPGPTTPPDGRAPSPATTTPRGNRADAGDTGTTFASQTRGRGDPAASHLP